MTLLQDIHKTITEDSNTLDSIPEDVLTELKKNIKAGAKDTEQIWGNALDLVHKSFEVSGVQRPTPDLKDAWKQYETLLQFAVEQLAKYRGMDADWRMSSAIFHEALERKYTFRIVELGSASSKSHDVESTDMQTIIDAILKQADKEYQVKVAKSKDKENPTGVVISFSNWGIRNNYQVRIHQVM